MQMDTAKTSNHDAQLARLKFFKSSKKYYLAFTIIFVGISIAYSLQHLHDGRYQEGATQAMLYLAVYRLVCQEMVILELRLQQSPRPAQPES